MHGGGTQVEKEAVGLEDAMSFEEGMDHALMRDSSQRPGEHDSVERCITIRETLGLTDLVTDLSGEPLRQILARLGYGFGLGVVGFQDGAEARESEREAAVAATDLEDTTPTPIGDTSERA